MSGPTDAAAERRLELERRLAALSPAKRALLERAAAVPQGARVRGIPRRASGAATPMSFAQELLWLLHRAAPDMHGYNVPRVVRLRGALRVEALRSALDHVVARHEVLRTTFDLVDGEPRQVVHEAASVPLERIDLRTTIAEAREDEAVRIVRDLVRRPFDLATDLQLRATLITLADDDNVLVLESHHVASDAWSRNILMREVAAYYTHGVTGSGDLPAVPAIQYGDFAIWQRETLRGEALEQALGYWREQLAGAPELLDLPTDRPRTGSPSFEGATRSRMIPIGLLDALRESSRAQGVTLFTTLLAAFDILLARYSGQDDVVVGSPIAGRAHPDTEGVIGYFANTLVLRTRLDGDPTFAQLVGRVRESTLGAFEHQDVPYEKLVRELQQSRSGRAALVQVMFTLQDAELRTLELPGLRSEPFGTSRGAAKFDLALFMHEQPGGLRAAIEYRTDLYDADTIDRMLEHLVRVLEQVAASPEVRVSEIDILTREERQLLLQSWNDTAAPFDSHATLHELIGAQCLRTPGSTALEWESDRGDIERLSFAELETCVATVARRLRALGARPGLGIGVCAERGPELVIAMLAAMRAGAYYLPLDPEYPAERLAFMLEDARVPVIVGTAAALDVLRSPRDAEHAPRVVTIAWTGDRLELEGANTPPSAGDEPARGATAADLAYVIYTSGSTGRPKGVMIPHRAVVNYLTWMAARFAVDQSDAVLQKAPASFDACIWEFFLPLVTGARLVLARPGGHQDPAYLLSALSRHSITLLQLVPSQLRMMMETPGFDDAPGLPRLRRLFLGGEALPPDLLQQVISACPSLAVTNLYGPTEATVYVTEWSTDARDWRGGTVPIGSPITNAIIRVVDPAGMLSPIGVAGELCIGGAGLATGYLNRPELTAERFVADRFAADPAARLYRTGDRARWRIDGSLEYLGRIDGQVKLRGFRVELGEIETALAAQPEVASAAVLVREDTPGDQRLAAYCIAETSSHASDELTDTLRGRLRSRLPEHMVPSTITWLDAWPLNANGKLDRKALPAPVIVPPRDRLEPRDDVERIVAQIWTDVLGRPVGALDDFFEVGGHSLLALRVLSRIAERTGVRVPLRFIFDAPTVAELASYVSSRNGGDRREEPALSGLATGDAPLTHAQEVLWLLQRTSPGSAAYNVGEQWIVSGAVDVAALSRAVAALLRRHDVFRTRFVVRDGVPAQSVRDASAEVLAIVDVAASDDPAAEALRIASDLAARPFDLERDPLVRFMLIVVAPAEYRLVFITHHIVFDGWSRGLLVRDLSALYAAERSSGDAPEAPAVRFADFAEWQRGDDGRAGHEAGLAFWRGHLAGAESALVLPEERGSARSAGDGAAKEIVELDEGLLRRVEALATRNDATLFMVLFAALQTVLHRYGDARDVVVATVHAGRAMSSLESVIGYFADTVAYRTTFDDATTFRDAVRQVRATHLAASEHADVPFETIAQLPGMPPLPRVLFALQNNARASLVLDGAVVRPTQLSSQGAKFDLFLSMSPTTNGLRATLQYRTSLFGAPAARRILGHLVSILRAVASDDDRSVATLPLLDAAEYELVVREWNATARAFDGSATLASLLERQMSTSPDAVALSDERGTMTYSELDTRSAALARRLAGLGARPGSFVAVCMQRTRDLVVALIATLRSGAAYVPIDPAYPASRIGFMLDDTRAPILVTDRATIRALPELRVAAPGTSRALVVVDDATEGATEPAFAATLPVAAQPDDVAYVIYTSGSTGRPKGVLIEHRNVVAFIDWARSVFTPAELRGVLASTSVCFDLSIFELFVPLTTGGTAVLVRDVLALAAPTGAFVAVPITLINTVPSAIAELLRSRSIPATVTTVNLAGELLPQATVDALYAIPTIARVYDLYGPSEDTTYSTFTLRRKGGRATIGRPIANTRAYVRDRTGAPVPVGIPGELFLAGAGVARGYHERDELTAERFVRDPFVSASDAGARMYRTGDLVRWLSTGELEYLGRLDNQVKLRGFRIELGEIDDALASLPSVVRAVTTVRDLGGDAALVSFLVVAGDTRIDASAVRAALAGRLPHYMLPSAVVVLDTIPMTANGKVDRRALGAIRIEAAPSTEIVPPRTATEIDLARIWAEVLRRDGFGVRHSFFDLGGHSLLAMRIVSRIDERFGVRLALGAVLEHPTIESLAAHVDASVGNLSAPGQPELRRASRVATRRPATTSEAAPDRTPPLPELRRDTAAQDLA